jgi:phage terminase large subunit-like protein
VTSPARRIADRFAALGAGEAHEALDSALAGLSVVDLALLLRVWPFWARPKQIIPQGSWKTVTLCTGIGWGKTRTLSEFVTGEVVAGRAKRVALCAQNEDKTFDVMVDGQSGLIAVSPWWCKARFEGGRVVWANGAEAALYTPEVPGAMRGPEHDLIWLSEIVAWPKATRDEALANILRRARLGYGKVCIDTSPTDRHPLIRKLLDRAARDPERHLLIRGEMKENIDNLTKGYVEGQYAEYAGTRQGDAELLGIFRDDAEDAMFRQAWIDAARRDAPAKYTRRVIALDPAISERRGTDMSGIIEAGLGPDGQAYVIADDTGRHQWEVWGARVLDRYVAGECDCIVAERNAGGSAIVANLRAVGRERGLTVTVVEAAAPTRYVQGTVYVKETFSRTSKQNRADPVATSYQKGRVSHVKGAALEELETELATWVPDAGMRSPNRLDALVFACWELLALGRDRKAAPTAEDAAAMAKAAATPYPGGGDIQRLLGRTEWSGGI